MHRTQYKLVKVVREKVAYQVSGKLLGAMTTAKMEQTQIVYKEFWVVFLMLKQEMDLQKRLQDCNESSYGEKSIQHTPIGQYRQW